MSLSGRIGEMAEFDLITRGDELPVFAFTTPSAVTGWDVFALSRRMRERGWQVPAYSFPENRTDLAALRVVCRNGFSQNLADLFFDDLRAVTQGLVTDPEAVGRTGPRASTTDFSPGQLAAAPARGTRAPPGCPSPRSPRRRPRGPRPDRPSRRSRSARVACQAW